MTRLLCFPLFPVEMDSGVRMYLKQLNSTWKRLIVGRNGTLVWPSAVTEAPLDCGVY